MKRITLAVLHATSGIRSAEDLDSISTMGFQECGVDRVGVEGLGPSRTSGLSAAGVQIDAEVIASTGPAAAARWHERDGSESFSSTPARRKFLRANTEQGHCVDVDESGHGTPAIGFTLGTDGRVVFDLAWINHPSSGLDLVGRELAEHARGERRSVRRCSWAGDVGDGGPADDRAG